MGQELGIEKIEEKFPGSLMQPKLEFDSVFPNLRSKIEAIIISNVGNEKFIALRDGLIEAIDENYEAVEITKNLQDDFTTIILSRSKGNNISKPVLGSFLSVINAGSPAMEFFDGFRQSYSTLDHPKSKEIHLNLELPQSWLGREGKRPNTLQQWTNQNGHGLRIINLVIRKEEGLIVNSSDLTEILNDPSSVQDLAPGEGYTIHKKQVSAIEMQPLLSLESSGPLGRGATDVTTYFMSHMVFFNERIINLNCMVINQELNAFQLNEEADKMRPLCNQVLNSFVLMNIYK